MAIKPRPLVAKPRPLVAKPRPLEVKPRPLVANTLPHSRATVNLDSMVSNKPHPQPNNLLNRCDQCTTYNY